MHHAQLWGTRAAKYEWLANDNNVTKTPWEIFTPQAPLYLFTPRGTTNEEEYTSGWKISDVFGLNGDPAPGIVTTQDGLAISWNKEEAINKVERLLATRTEAEARKLWRLCSQDQWHYEWAKRDLPKMNWRDEAVKILYRPFDIRWTIFNRYVAVHRRERVMRHMLAGANMGLITNRQVNGSFRHSLCSRDIINDCTVSTETRERSYLFPLYLYPDPNKRELWSDESPSDAPGGRRPNLAPAFVAELTQKLGLAWVSDGRGDLQTTIGPEDVFHYIYALLSTLGYRERYAEFLKSDFPRLPLTSDTKLFQAFCGLGAQLTQLHLMERQWANSELPGYPQAGDNGVERIIYTAPGEGIGEDRALGRVWINATQYFAGIAPEVWEFHIGGYQVCEKWLKDRKGRILTYEDIQHYRQMAVALGETLRLMNALDDVIEEHGGWPLG